MGTNWSPPKTRGGSLVGCPYEKESGILGYIKVP